MCRGHVLTRRERRLSERMTSYWANFAKRGDPNGPGVPSWPRYRRRAERILTLDAPLTVGRAYHSNQCAFLDTLPQPFPAG